MINYKIKKAEERQLTIDFQNEFYKKGFYYSELAESSENFYKLGKRYGLLREKTTISPDHNGGQV